MNEADRLVATKRAFSEPQEAGSIQVVTSRGDVLTAPPPAYTSEQWKRGGLGGADALELAEKRLKGELSWQTSV